KDFVPVVRDALLAPGPLRVTREDQSCGSVGVNRAVYVLVEQVHVEVVKPSMLVLERKERLPPQPIIDGEALRGFPGVLYILAKISLPIIKIRLNVAGAPTERLPQKKIGETKPAANASVKGHQAGRIDSRFVIEAGVDVV